MTQQNTHPHAAVVEFALSLQASSLRPASSDLERDGVIFRAIESILNAGYAPLEPLSVDDYRAIARQVWSRSLPSPEIERSVAEPGPKLGVTQPDKKVRQAPELTKTERALLAQAVAAFDRYRARFPRVKDAIASLRDRGQKIDATAIWSLRTGQVFARAGKKWYRKYSTAKIEGWIAAMESWAPPLPAQPVAFEIEWPGTTDEIAVANQLAKEAVAPKAETGLRKATRRDRRKAVVESQRITAENALLVNLRRLTSNLKLVSPKTVSASLGMHESKAKELLDTLVAKGELKRAGDYYKRVVAGSGASKSPSSSAILPSISSSGPANTIVATGTVSSVTARAD